jgi:peptidoglycan/xylan/chitin deacetylase (PgdA/CDA1 family)
MPFNNMRPILRLLLLGIILSTGCTGQFLPKNQTPVTARTDRFIMVSVATGDTYASLAETYLKDKNRAWQIAASNQNKPLSPGQRIIIPLVPVSYGGLQNNGYQTVPVLVYTELAAAPSKSKIVSARNFHQQLDYLSTNGFVPVSLDQFHGFLELKDQLPPKAVVITFDTTAAWAYDIAYPALKQRGMKAAIFISPDQVGQKGNVTWGQLAEMVSAGMDVGLYGPSIKAPAKEDVKTYLETLETKFTDPQKIFQRQLKQPCRYFAYPQGESNDLIIALLKKHGYQAAFTRKRGNNPFFADNFKIKRSMIYGHYDMARFSQNLTTFHSAELK